MEPDERIAFENVAGRIIKDFEPRLADGEFFKELQRFLDSFFASPGWLTEYTEFKQNLAEVFSDADRTAILFLLQFSPLILSRFLGTFSLPEARRNYVKLATLYSKKILQAENFYQDPYGYYQTGMNVDPQGRCTLLVFKNSGEVVGLSSNADNLLALCSLVLRTLRKPEHVGLINDRGNLQQIRDDAEAILNQRFDGGEEGER